MICSFRRIHVNEAYPSGTVIRKEKAGMFYDAMLMPRSYAMWRRFSMA